MDQARPSCELSTHPTMRSRFPQIGRPVPLMNPIRRRPCADPGQKQVPGEWMTQKGIDSSRPVTEASRAKLNKAHERSHHGHTGNHPAFPAQWFYGLLRALPGDQACLTPSPALLIADLTPALGRQNDTTWPYASASFVRLAIARLTPPRPSHPASRS